MKKKLYMRHKDHFLKYLHLKCVIRLNFVWITEKFYSDVHHDDYHEDNFKLNYILFILNTKIRFIYNDPSYNLRDI